MGMLLKEFHGARTAIHSSIFLKLALSVQYLLNIETHKMTAEGSNIPFAHRHHGVRHHQRQDTEAPHEYHVP